MEEWQAENDDAASEIDDLVARCEFFAAQEGNSYRLIQKRLKRAQHWVSKKEVEVAQNAIKKLHFEFQGGDDRLSLRVRNNTDQPFLIKHVLCDIACTTDVTSSAMRARELYE